MKQQIQGIIKSVSVVLTLENNEDMVVICDQGSLAQLATFRIGEHAKVTGRLAATLDLKLAMAATAITRR